MNKKVQVLQIGLKNWEEEIPAFQKEKIEWFYLNPRKIDELLIEKIIGKNKKVFDAVLCTEYVDSNILNTISEGIEAYSLIIDQTLKKVVSSEIKNLKLPVFMNLKDKNWVINEIYNNFFTGQYGDKLSVDMIVVDEEFKGRKFLQGSSYLVIEGDFEAIKGKPILSWQRNIYLGNRQKKIWLEYEKSSDVELFLTIIEQANGSGEPLRERVLSEEEFREGVEFDNDPQVGTLGLALSASGVGEFKVGPFHVRDSRRNYGEFIAGGKKIYDDRNQEIFYYFNPGDLRPPLNVYFSGYKTAEGFEGFFMMKKLGAPFLLITDPRLEGGAFYMGSSSLEGQLVNVIQGCLNKLGFSNNQLILTGLSMGTFGALYYSTHLKPHSVIIGKPLANIGNIAQNEKFVRPGGFPTSLDILRFYTGGLTREHINNLNERFWNSFCTPSCRDTQFVIAYMLNDDYDCSAYNDIVRNLSKTEGGRVIGKGILGRHNDNDQVLFQWFINQHKRILREYFNRREGNGF